jgi:hypothetical protein
MAMTAVVAMSAAFGILRRRKVAHWNFVLFVHITFLRNVWVVSVVRIFFRFDLLTAKV